MAATTVRTHEPHEPKRATPLATLLIAAALVGIMLWRVGHPPSPQPHAERNPGFRVDVNRSDADTLQLLPGLGPSIAENVVTRRETVGPFRSKAELQDVRMIGPVLRERIEPWVTLGPPQPPGVFLGDSVPRPTRRWTPGDEGEAPR